MGYFDDIADIPRTQTSTKPVYGPVKPAYTPPKPIAPRGESSAYPGLPSKKLDNGNTLYMKPNGGSIEVRPDGSFISKLPAFLGGGAYEASKGGGLIGTAQDRQATRDYAGLPSLTGKQRDHIIPVSLGGISTSKTNLRSVPSNENPADFESDLAERVRKGEITPMRARQEVMTFKQNQTNPQPSGWQNFMDALGEKLPGAAQTGEELHSNPLSLHGDFKKTFSNMWSAIKEPVLEEKKRIGEIFQAKSIPDFIGKEISGATGAANVVFSPISALFAGANEVPILGTVSRLVTLPFQVMGESGSAVSGAVIDKLPISQKTKDAIKPGLQEMASLAAQFALGKAGLEAKTWEGLKSKFGEKDATTIVRKAQEIAYEQQKIEQQNAVIKEQSQKAIEQKAVEDPLITEARKYKSADEFVSKQPKLYHGTSGDFTEFQSMNQLRNSKTDIKPSNIGGNSPLISLTEDKTMASNYAKLRQTNMGGKANVREVSVNGKILDLTDNLNMSFGQIEDPSSPLIKRLRDGGYAGVKFLDKSPASGVLVETTAVFPESIKTKSQLTDIWNKANEGKIEADTQFKSRVFERMKAENPQLQGELKVDRVNMEKDISKAVDLITKDKQKAYDIAMGKEISNDITATSTNIALAEKALAEGNHDLYSKLVTKRSLDQTRRGQEIVAEKGSVTDNSTSRYVKELIASKLEKLGQDYLSNLKDPFKRKSTKERAMAKIDSEVSNLEAKIKNKKLDTKSALSLLDKLTCV